MATRAVALVESPAQLLNVIEWAHAENSYGADIGAGVTIMIIAPLQEAAREQLQRMGELARDCGFDVKWREVRGQAAGGLRGMRSMLAEIGPVPTLIIGDPFSGYLQFMISFSRAEQLVVIDDGSATLEFAEILNSRKPLLRWHRRAHTSTLGRGMASLARQRMTTGPGPWNARRPLRLFTAMPVRQAGGCVINRHTYDWTRSSFAPPRTIDGADLVGTSLVESGVVDHDHYLRAVRALAVRHRITRYLAHRRESTEKLAEISALGLTVVRPDLPLEIFARIGPIGERVISFPSTVVHTLPLALADSPVQVLVCAVEAQWLSPTHATSGRFLSSVTDSARQLHGLNCVAA